MAEQKRVPCLLAPFYWLWSFIAWIISLTGRMIAVVIGFLLMAAGVLLSLTVVGAIIGIPLALFGLLLVVRGLW